MIGSSIINIFKVENLRSRILFTLLMIVVYRIGTHIPVPYLDPDALKALILEHGQEGAFGMLNLFSGGAMLHASILGLGIMPYITASIIVQMLSMDVVPAFTRWSKEGELGRRKLTKFTRYLTILFAIPQAWFSPGLLESFAKGRKLILSDSIWVHAFIALTLIAGTAFLMWMGEQITEHGIGNGISILIFAGIVASLPTLLGTMYSTFFSDDKREVLLMGGLKFIGILLVLLAIVVAVIYIQEGVRRIPVQYTKRVVGRKMYGGRSTHIPLKVNTAGVIPVILALSLLTTPRLFFNFFPNSPVATWVAQNLDWSKFGLGMAIYALLILLFTFFYTLVQFNPTQLAEQMQKNGGFIPGVRPGKTTEQYLTKILYRLTVTGAFFLVAISILPVLIFEQAGLPQTAQIGGTSLLIVVGVALETMKTIESQLVRRHHKGFL